MAKLRLSFVTNRHERVEPLCDGTVPIEGAELVTTYSDPSETFWRQLKFQEFDVSEMSISSFLIARDRGLEGAYLPVFPSRQFFWTGWSYHTDSGIKTASEGHKFHLDSQLEVVLIRRPILLRSSKILFGQEILELLKNLGIRLERFSNPAMVSHVVVRK